MKNMKGQSAIEYLTTYGWAILVLVIILGLLVGSGIFSPNYLVTEECNIGPKFLCRAIIFKEQDTGNLKVVMNLSNGFEYKIKIKRVGISFLDKDQQFEVKTSSSDLGSGGSTIINATLANYNTVKDSTKRFKVEIDYYSCAQEVNPNCDEISTHRISGRITGKVN